MAVPDIFAGPLKLSYVESTNIATVSVRGVTVFTFDADGGGASTYPGNMTVTGTSTTTGASTLTGNTAITGTLGVTGLTSVVNAAASGTLAVTGASTLTGEVNGIPNAELETIDPSQKVTYLTDWLGDLIPDEQAVTAGSGTGNAVALSPGAGGRLSITTASDDGLITANASAWELGALDWRADQGGLVMEARLQIDDISEAYIFIGFTDVLPSGTLEAPVFLNAGDIDSDAANACGVFYDVDATTDEWCHGGVAGDTDTVPAFSGSAPTEGAYETIRVEVSATGGVRGFIGGTAIGAEVASAVTATTPLCPVIVVANRSANAVVTLVDYVWVQADR